MTDFTQFSLRRTLFNNFWKIIDAEHKPKAIRLNLYLPDLVLNTVFYRSSSAIGKWYPIDKSELKKCEDTNTTIYLNIIAFRILYIYLIVDSRFFDSYLLNSYKTSSRDALFVYNDCNTLLWCISLNTAETSISYHSGMLRSVIIKIISSILLVCHLFNMHIRVTSSVNNF